MSDHHDDNTKSHDDEDGDSRQALLRTCLRYIELAKPVLEETQRLLDAPRLRRQTGLAAFIRSLKQEESTLRRLASSLTSSREEDGHPSSVTVNGDTKQPGRGRTKVARTIEAATIEINHAILHWSILKRCRAVVAVNQTFQGRSRDQIRANISDDVTGRERSILYKTLRGQGRVEVHVADWGKEWLEIRPLQEERLARQMTDSGWSWGDHAKGDVVDAEEWEEISLAKQVRKLVAAARANRCEYEVPRVKLVLPNISRANEDIDVFLDQLSRMDPMVQVIVEDKDSAFLTSSPLDVDTALNNMIGDECQDNLTQTLNLDHTILIDLISDITHCHLQPEPWQPLSTREQIAEEQSGEEGSMMAVLARVLEGRRLVCTKEAAEHLHEVLSTVGTDTEKERGRLLVPMMPDDQQDQTPSLSPEAIRARFQALSVHALPPTMRLPITILPEPWTTSTVQSAIQSGTLPPVALDLQRVSGFSSSKLSIFAYGWASGHVTVTSNKEVRGQIRTMVEAARRKMEEEKEQDEEKKGKGKDGGGEGREMAEGMKGPRIWRVDVTRNLLAKNAKPREDGSMHCGR